MLFQANLSDIFEYVSEEDSNQLFESIINKCRKKGRIAYWNFWVTRSPAKCLYDKGIVERLDKLSERLHKEDGMFCWRSFNVDEVL
jgi:S-adenosylmethionine-diacylglycerol 3-amino-3-carboxypropyl transferase